MRDLVVRTGISLAAALEVVPGASYSAQRLGLPEEIHQA
jgi:hypothetical protein